MNEHYYAALSPEGRLIQSSIRSKAGDVGSAISRRRDYEQCKLVVVRVTVEEDTPFVFRSQGVFNAAYCEEYSI